MSRPLVSYVLTAPTTPGAQPSHQGSYSNLRLARAAAKKRFAGRRDLVGQDVRIERADGQLVEYAGPAR